MKKLMIASLIALSFNAVAQPIETQQSNHDKLDTSLSQLVHVEGQVMAIVTPDEHGGFEEADVKMIVSEEYKDVYVTKKQAKYMGLDKTRRYFLTSTHSFEALEGEIMKRVGKDNPDYFSVQYYQHIVGDADITEYSARVTEYK
ncbi:hypothetical protein [Photobacterium rosenbergii]|uniref:Uncharacterized protein n=1 Tax=Photobacterium rosenbergii TaxID=294936 RepID=A0ABU3ZEN5_9GAMM|nr:hypothetical protein [Photobacterium rosenbergii]MDV5168550.1 hypothetical protein [Photobacterium rosenbergii]